MSETKICKYCKSEIPKDAKICPQCRKKQKGKGGLIAIIVIVVIIAIAGLGGNNDSKDVAKDATNDSTNTTTTENTETSSETSTDTKTTDDSYEKYQSIQMGQSLEEVENVLGTEKTVSSSTEVAGIKTEIYAWNVGLANSITVTFTDGKVSGRGQVGITAADAVEITADQFSEVQNGMSYEEVCNVLGGAGTEDSYSEIMGSETVSYTWSGSSLGSNATIIFIDGKVSSMTQVGL